jgi:hypothetical protein
VLILLDGPSGDRAKELAVYLRGGEWVALLAEESLEAGNAIAIRPHSK